MSSPQFARDQPGSFTNRVEKIAIVGVTGQCGKYVTEALLGTGKHQITAITRAGSSSNMPQGLAVKPVDYNDHASIVSALQGHDVLIIFMAVSAPQDTQGKIIRAAADANIPWVMPNDWANDYVDTAVAKDTLFGEALIQHRKLVEDLGKSSWVSLSCGFWYEYSLSFNEASYGFNFKDKKVTFYGDGTAVIDTTTWPQVGRAVASLLSMKILPDDADDQSPCLSRWRNDIVRISSFNVSQKDMFASVLRVTGDSEKDWTVLHEPAKERYQSGMEIMQQGNYMGYVQLLYARFFFGDDAGNFRKRAHIENEVLALPEENMDDYTKTAIEWAMQKAEQ